jgi:hypothetical protein
VTAFLTFGQRWLGDPGGGSLTTTRLASLGFSVRTTDKLRLGLSLDYREPSSARGSSARELTAFAALRLSERWKLSPYVVLGTTDASADYALGFTLSYRLR